MLLANGKEPYFEILSLRTFILVTVPGRDWEWTRDLMNGLVTDPKQVKAGYPWFKIKENGPLGMTLFLCSWPALFGPTSPQRNILRKSLITVLPDMAKEFTD